jgi:hypothetical protein
VCVLEVEDLETYLGTVGTDDAVAEWERSVSRFKDSGVDTDADPQEQLPLMERVWTLPE